MYKHGGRYWASSVNIKWKCNDSWYFWLTVCVFSDNFENTGWLFYFVFGYPFALPSIACILVDFPLPARCSRIFVVRFGFDFLTFKLCQILLLRFGNDENNNISLIFPAKKYTFMKSYYKETRLNSIASCSPSNFASHHIRRFNCYNS